MAQYENIAEEASIRLAFTPLDRKALGLAAGIVAGALLFITTMIVVMKGGGARFQLQLLNQFLWGYSVTLGGAFIGLLWGLALGFGLGWGFAVLRNLVIWIWLTVVRSRAEMDQYSDLLDHL